MGTCLSIRPATAAAAGRPTAKVVTADGHLREHHGPVSAAEALANLDGPDVAAASFLCSSDRLFFDRPIPPLPPDELLHPGQVYFALPKGMLRQPLSAADMAALAALAGEALAGAAPAEGVGPRRRFGRKKMKICPVLDPADPMAGRVVEYGIDHPMGGYGFENFTVGKASAAPRLVKSGSVRKMQRGASRRARMAVRSFRVMLDTIHEGTVSA